MHEKWGCIISQSHSAGRCEFTWRLVLDKDGRSLGSHKAKDLDGVGICPGYEQKIDNQEFEVARTPITVLASILLVMIWLFLALR